jgi:hypothetical protein
MAGVPVILPDKLTLSPGGSEEDEYVTARPFPAPCAFSPFSVWS